MKRNIGSAYDFIHFNLKFSWMIEIEDSSMNDFVKNELRKHYEPQVLIPGIKLDRQYWIGAKISVSSQAISMYLSTDLYASL